MKTKICSKCKKEKAITEFHGRHTRAKGATHSWCRSCNSRDSTERGRNFKLSCVKYKGGKCEICSYDKCIAALEFHHLDAEQKDFQISKVRSKKFNKEIEKELDKCILLCSNCHKEVHWKQNTPM